MSRKFKIYILLGTALLGLIIAFLVKPIPQDLKYHQFADQRLLLGIPHFGDVLSNLPFLIIGIWGLILLLRYSNDPKRMESKAEISSWIVAFLGIALVGPGSAYYHNHPTNETLIWDRLPIAVGFMGIFCIMVSERVQINYGKRLLWPLVALAIISVLYWAITEKNFAGDLRLYGFVIFYPMIGIPLLLILFPPKYSGVRYVIEMLILYAIAKVFEATDKEIFSWTQEIISGHTLKHLFSAAATWSLIRYISFRRLVHKENT